MTVVGRPGGGTPALANGLKDLLKPGVACGQDRAPGDDRAHIDQDRVRDQRGEVELLKRVVRLEDDDLRVQGKRGLDRTWVMRRSERCLDTDLGTKVLRDAFTEQRVLIEDHNSVLGFPCHRLAPSKVGGGT